MPPRGADTIRILIATDSHVGYAERDPVRKDDSWTSFDEVMQLAKTQDVDMVLLAGDLFHDNAPSRKAMFQVMRSLRQNCLGDKPVELEFLSDATDVLGTAVVNYEDPDINISIPVFSIHGNHDDPSGEGHFCSLDLLQVSGLLNYFGKVPETDNIEVKPVLLQKGQTKLALYGLSNVRDERLFRTFKDKQVKFYTPGTQKNDWFNLMAVHQNHHAHTDTSYLPENFLPDFMDLVVWGHEHECLIDPRLNPEMMFQVMQPGSSIATSLVPGEAVSKHVAIINVTGKEFTVEKHRIKTVRPFIMKELVLATDPQFKGLAKLKDNKVKVIERLMHVVKQLIKDAKDDWLAIQDPDDMPEEIPLPLVRLKVEYSAPEGGKFDIENPQRFSNRFAGEVANITDVIQFHKKKVGTKKDKIESNLPDASILADLNNDNVKVNELVTEFLAAQTLKIIPQGEFGDAIEQYVQDKDKFIVDTFVEVVLKTQMDEMLKLVDNEEEDTKIDEQMEEIRVKQEAAWAAGHRRQFKRKGKLNPRPADWDDEYGLWEDQPDAYEEDENEEEDEDDNASVISGTKKKPAAKKTAAKKAPAKARAPAKTRAAKAPAKAAATRAPRKKAPSDDEDEDDDVIMLDESPPPKAQPKRAAAAKGRQTQLNFTQSQAKKRATEISDDEISDDDDAFEVLPAKKRK